MSTCAAKDKNARAVYQERRQRLESRIKNQKQNCNKKIKNREMVSPKQNDTGINETTEYEKKKDQKQTPKIRQKETPPQDGNEKRAETDDSFGESPRQGVRRSWRWKGRRKKKQKQRQNPEPCNETSQPKPNPTRCKCDSTRMSNAPGIDKNGTKHRRSQRKSDKRYCLSRGLLR